MNITYPAKNAVFARQKQDSSDGLLVYVNEYMNTFNSGT